MTEKRKKTQEFIIKYIDKIAPGGENKKLYTDLFNSMSDKEFNRFMEKLSNGMNLSVIAPNGSKIKLDVDRNIKIAKELGYDFFQRLNIWEHDGLPAIKTPNKYMVMSLPVRRMAQLLTKYISIPTDDKSIDLTTGQVTGKSKGSKLTMPELQILAGLGLKDSVVELMKYRGGDRGGMNALSKSLFINGTASQKVLEQYATGVVSKQTLKSYFNAMHIKAKGLQL